VKCFSPVLGDRGVCGEFRRGKECDDLDEEFWEEEYAMHLARVSQE